MIETDSYVPLREPSCVNNLHYVGFTVMLVSFFVAHAHVSIAKVVS
jgi:hypothetical protein